MKGVAANSVSAGLTPKDDFPPLPARLNGKQGRKGATAAAPNATSSSGKCSIAESMNAISFAQGVEPPDGLDVGTAGLVGLEGVGQKNAKLGSSKNNSGHQPKAQFLGSGVVGSGVVGNCKGVVGQKLKNLGSNMEKSGQQPNLKQGELNGGKNWSGLFKDNRTPIQCTNLICFSLIHLNLFQICALEKSWKNLPFWNS